jgi:hypothetical protein
VRIPPTGHTREYEKPTASKKTKPFGMLFSGYPVGCSGIQGWAAALILISLPLIYRHVLARGAELNCITRRDALILAFDLALQRRRIAVILLEAACLELPPEFLNITPSSPEWLNGIAGELDWRICTPQNLKRPVATCAIVKLDPSSFFIFNR